MRSVRSGPAFGRERGVYWRRTSRSASTGLRSASARFTTSPTIAGTGGRGRRPSGSLPSRSGAESSMDAPLLTDDFKEFLRLFNAHRVEYPRHQINRRRCVREARIFLPNGPVSITILPFVAGERFDTERLQPQVEFTGLRIAAASSGRASPPQVRGPHPRIPETPRHFGRARRDARASHA